MSAFREQALSARDQMQVFTTHPGDSDRRFTVDSKIKSRHTANAVLKQAGLPKPF